MVRGRVLEIKIVRVFIPERLRLLITNGLRPNVSRVVRGVTDKFDFEVLVDFEFFPTKIHVEHLFKLYDI